MEGVAGTGSLRKAAAHWSLAGDKQLLDLLQTLHEGIVTKCQEANSSLEEMVNNLDTASISLQNVNNRLMALSNSQFVESRVYEDDVDVAAQDPPVKETPKATEPTSELNKLRDSLRVLEAYHELVHIVDSDSDSISDEEEDRMVFKPKDLYADRPLPYIIGSQQWRSKWHAGLVPEESDSDSDTSKANAPSDQYSDSEPDGDDVIPGKPHVEPQTISTNSSLGSELTIPTMGKPADIAAELARRLGGNIPRIPEPEPETLPAAPGPTKVYGPQQPPSATIFSDEPPPLDVDRAEQSDEPYQSDSEDDVFAELHRRAQPPRAPVERLFGQLPNVYGRSDRYDNEGGGRPPNAPTKQPQPLFEESEDSKLFVDRPTNEEKSVHTDRQPETSVKKPIGGISLFGNNHGTESIGAAILKRNQRKDLSSDEEVEQVAKINDNTDRNKAKTETGHSSIDTIQKDLINDLFSKSNKSKKPNMKVEKTSAVTTEKPVTKKVDLFTDDLFDDIDDIFTNVKPTVKQTKETMKKSLFDDDDDDLFANVAESSKKTSPKPEPKSRSIFDSDDDLFSEKVENNAAKLNSTTKTSKEPLEITNNGLLSEENVNIDKGTVKTVAETKADHSVKEKPEAVRLSDHENVPIVPKEGKPIQDKSLPKNSQVKSIFDSDSDDDIFSDLNTANTDSTTTQINKRNIMHNENKTVPHSTVDEDSIRQIDSNDILHRGSNEIKTIDDENDLFEDNSLFIQKPRDSSKNISTVSNNSDIANDVVSVNQIEDNDEKTDQLLTRSVEKTPEVENNTKIYVEDKFSSTNKNDSVLKSKEISSVLSHTNILKSQVQSPSLFDEDDDLEDIFTKSPDSNKPKEIDLNLDSSTADKSSQLAIDKDNISDKFSHVEEYNAIHTEHNNQLHVSIDSNTNSNFIQSYNENEIKSDISDSPTKKYDKSEIFEDVSVEPGQDPDTNIITNNLQDCLPNEYIREQKNEMKTDYDNIQTDFIQKDTLFSESEVPVLGEPDIFSDIFSDIPPDFERPKEPKKSKNVNALFDDDSDDEALFFKKNEIVNDEKPDVSFAAQEDRLFHIFHDEPPAMDVDFTQKPKKHPVSFLETPPDKIYSEEISSQAETSKHKNDKPAFSGEKQIESSTSADSESEKIIDESKKPVGKLKPMNFNINVNTLLPGASPKRTKTNEQVDGQVISIKTTEDVIKSEESKMVKSVSFEGDPESEVLDNKLSKERAKIQVKRRPSTRRARKEAVRKSGIDFGDDSTDNSSSTDISKRDNSADKTDGISTSSNINTHMKRTNTSKKDDTIFNKSIKDKGNQNSHNEVADTSKFDVFDKQSKCDVEKESKLLSNAEKNIVENLDHSHSSPSDIISKETNDNNKLTTAFNKRPNVKSKVVYILNDEDIFTDSNTANVRKVPDETQSVVKSKVLNIVDDDDDLFKSSTKTNNVATAGNVHKDVNSKTNEIGNFDSDEDIFKASQSKLVKNHKSKPNTGNNKDEIDKLEAKIDKFFVKTQSTKAKVSLFDDLSDDESELFGDKKSMKTPVVSDNSNVISTIKKEVKLPKNAVKQSLFGDESDDDDLFGVKTTKKEPAQLLPKPKEVTSKSTEPVFEDPLSMLREDDDI